MGIQVKTLADLFQIRTPTEVEIGPVLILAIRERETRIAKRPFRSVRVRDQTSALNLNSYTPSSSLYTRLDTLSEEIVIDAIGQWNPEYPSIELKDFSVREDVSPSVFSDDQIKHQVTNQLEELIQSITEPFCHQLLTEIFTNSDHREHFLSAPASRANHHAYPSGLAVHSLEVAAFADRLCQVISDVPRDWLATCALLHDIGKIYVYDLTGDYTDAGKLKGHVIIGYDLMTRMIDTIPDFSVALRRELEHSILAHMGPVRRGYGSCTDPTTRIAVLIHQLDDLSAALARG